MKRALIISVSGLLAQPLFAADSKEKVVSSAKELAEKPNYSWTTTSKEADGSSARLGAVSGKSDKDGLTYLTFEVSEVPVEVYMKGEKGTAKGLEGWQTFEEIAQGPYGAIIRFLRSYKAPALESSDLAKKATDLKEAEGAFSGELKEDAVKELLLRFARRREGQDAPKIENPKGTIKFWIKDGALTKYETNVQGKITAGERETDVNRTITVEIKDAGSTKLELPAEAKEKMT